MLFPWVPHHKFAFVKKLNHVATSVSGANAVPLGSHHQHADSALDRSEDNIAHKHSVFLRLVFPRKSVFQRLNFSNFNGSVRTNFRHGQKVPVPTGPPGSKHPSDLGSKPTCPSCLTPNHSRFGCPNRIKCWHCKQWGHVLTSCKLFKDLQSFIGMASFPPDSNFSNLTPTTCWSPSTWASWFSRPAFRPAGPSPSGPPVFSSFKDLFDSLTSQASPALSPSPPAASSPQVFTPATENPPCTAAPPTPAILFGSSDMALLNINPVDVPLPGYSRVLVQGVRPLFGW